ncbi:MAG: phosphate ABC transporter ATP-binding protein [Proteobacteria bacterium]|nr:phosphate ABC transporter ATP-binding protein [Pseudomonadota bacterium]
MSALHEPVMTPITSVNGDDLPTPLRRRLLIEANCVTLCYGQHTAFRDITLPIEENSITALVGPSGCGKSSFLSCLNRLTDLYKQCKVTGSILFDGDDILRPNVDVLNLRRRVGLIFQKPNPLPLSIRENLTLPLREHGHGNTAELNRKVESVLVDVGLWDEVRDRLDSPALALSGGQQQRLCIARAIALEPDVLLLDEPCSALDPISSGVVEDRIASLRDRYTIVIVTHNLAQARRIADTTALLWVRDGAGHLVEYAPTREFFESPQQEITAAYIQGARG